MSASYMDRTVYPYRRYTMRRDGVERVEIFTFGNTGYRKDGKFSRTFKGLQAKL